MKDNFIWVKKWEKVYITTKLATVIQEIGMMIKKKDMEKCTGQIKAKHIKVFGKIIYLKVLVNSNGKKKVEI